MDQPPDPFEFLRNLWGPMGLPLAGVMAPTHVQDELGRRIAELKSVENWLNMNLRCGQRASGPRRTGRRSRRSSEKIIPAPDGRR
jgi:hypothetical protein